MGRRGGAAYCPALNPSPNTRLVSLVAGNDVIAGLCSTGAVITVISVITAAAGLNSGRHTAARKEYQKEEETDSMLRV